MTDLDWSPELLIACHDEDEQNARLARHVWEDNGLDVPETFLAHLLEYLGVFRSVSLNVCCISFSSGHENAYVRSSLADAIVEGIEHWPHMIKKAVENLQDYYRDKVGVLYQSKFLLSTST